jgi:hypothetical protein
MTTFQIPTVNTDRLRLRAFQASDLDAYVVMQAKPEVMRYMVMGRTSTRAGGLANDAHVGRLVGVAGLWHVGCEKIDDGVFVGSVGIFEPLDWPEPEIAYSLDQPFWHQGFATAAARGSPAWVRSPCCCAAQGRKRAFHSRSGSTRSTRTSRLPGGVDACHIDLPIYDQPLQTSSQLAIVFVL